MKKDNKFLYSLLLSNKVVITIHDLLAPTLTFKSTHTHTHTHINSQSIQLDFN